MPLYWVYVFMSPVGSEGEEPEESYWYAEDEKNARKLYKNYHGQDAGELIRRDSW